MENTARRQGEVDRACKPKQVPPGTKDRKVSRGKRYGDLFVCVLECVVFVF